MNVHFQGQDVSTLASTVADALALVVVGESLPKALDGACLKLLDDAVKQGDLQLKPGGKLYVHRPAGLRAPRFAVAIAADGSAKAFKAALLLALGQLPQGVKHVAVALVGAAVEEAHAEALAIAAADATYLYRHTKPSAPKASSLSKLTLIADKTQSLAVAKGLRTGEAIAAGVTTARELANRPGNHCTPTFLGTEAQRIGKRFGMKVEVHGRKAIERIGMGSFLAVAQGSTEPPCFIVMQYRGDAAKNAATHVLVGKGITFDSGGISLKPGAEMDEMKFDMGGAASVLGTMTALGELKPKLNVVALIPSCENMPSGLALKPGDVITSLSGKTIEVLNTDAEGRLILCDALTYAERFKPASVIDIATLTGACVVALGHHHSGLFSPDDDLAEALLAASRRALDPAWRMPLDAEYDEGLKSNFADIPNIAGRAGGAITAALFLKRFTDKKFPWAHLDVAGTAWKSGASKGATGRPVGLLTHYLLGRLAPATPATPTRRRS
jgi:leucyl aminopeptidase